MNKSIELLIIVTYHYGDMNLLDCALEVDDHFADMFIRYGDDDG
jgi:hypothetical protein